MIELEVSNTVVYCKQNPELWNYSKMESQILLNYTIVLYSVDFNCLHFSVMRN